MIELKSCPFCGTSEGHVVEKEYLTKYRVECFCGIAGPYGDTGEEAEKYWDMLKRKCSKRSDDDNK